MVVGKQAGPLIAVCGTSDANADEAAAAQAVGRAIAERGGVVVCGGLGGVMEAVAAGAASANGVSIGLLPGDDRAQAAPDITYSLPTGMREMRNGLIARVAQGMVAIGGGYGTLSEIAFMLRIGRPVAALGTWEFSEPRAGWQEATFHKTDNAQTAVDWIFSAIEKGKS